MAAVFANHVLREIEFLMAGGHDIREYIAVGLTECFANVNGGTGRVYRTYKPKKAELSDAENQLYRQAPDLLFVPETWTPEDLQAWYNMTIDQRCARLSAEQPPGIPTAHHTLRISISICSRKADFDNRIIARIYQTTCPAILFYYPEKKILSMASHGDMTQGSTFRIEPRSERERGNYHDYHLQQRQVVEYFRCVDAPGVTGMLVQMWNDADARGELMYWDGPDGVTNQMQAAYRERFPDVTPPFPAPH